ncbi:hypothetical protein EX30DRAFT_78477 [Ascodesmis nigricans]|uniref:Uncharacterized protein n=1 Tax=Ascodesmis nigricans TaxID=341454 RepID=A0A4S2MSX6_9PEZI|nr:hypothetical protein EX30DRAFT_78477 [Ascodesmis nigricans]
MPTVTGKCGVENHNRTCHVTILELKVLTCVNRHRQEFAGLGHSSLDFHSHWPQSLPIHRTFQKLPDSPMEVVGCNGSELTGRVHRGSPPEHFCLSRSASVMAAHIRSALLLLFLLLLFLLLQAPWYSPCAVPD